MSKTALVLSGGGAKAAYQAAAEKYLREVKGYRWDVISGVSAGALNGAMIAMGKPDRMWEIWNRLTPEMVYSGPTKGWKTVAKLLFGAKSVYDTSPLAKLINAEIDPTQIVDVDLRIGVVSLITGEYSVIRPDNPHFKKALLASASIPTIFPPVDISPDMLAMVDGSLRNYSPIGDIMDAEPDEIVVINCAPRVPARLSEPPRNALRIGQRAIDIATNEIFLNDLRKFLRINRLVELALPQGITLCNKSGRPYRHFKCTIIEPNKELGDALDFSRANLDRCLKAGLEDARKVMG